MAQNDLGLLEHQPRTLTLDITTRPGTAREIDRNVVAVVQRKGDFTKPIMGCVRNLGRTTLTLTIEESSDGDAADPFGGSKGTVTFVGQPTDGETVTIDDGPGAAVVFEFDNNASVVETSTLRRVVIGANTRETAQNLLAAINAAAELDVEAVDKTPQGYRQAAAGGVATPTPVVEITNKATGAAGNVAITTTANPEVVVAGLSGGRDPIAFRSEGANVTSLAIVPGGGAVFILEAATEAYLRFKATPTLDTDERHGYITLAHFFGKLEEGDPAFGRLSV